MSELTYIYDSLYQFESKRRGRSYPIHKKLKLEKDKCLLDLIEEKVPIIEGENILDAGCGTGHTLFHLHKKYGIQGTGISISQKEIDSAISERETLKINSDELKFMVQSFDHGLSQKYDKIIAIESLKHSTDLYKTAKNLARHLKDGGKIIVVDDFRKIFTRDCLRHQKLWKADSFNSIGFFKDAFSSAGRFDIEQVDLTDHVPARTHIMMGLTSSLLNIGMKLVPHDYRRNIKTYKGALLLEEMYRLGQVKYLLLILTKQNQDENRK